MFRPPLRKQKRAGAILAIASLFLQATGPASLFAIPAASAVTVTPYCNGLPATIYVDSGTIVGGPDNGDAYAGTLNGTNGDDVIVGTSGDDTIWGNNGDDTICGREGNDIIHGENGADYILGGPGIDQLTGGNGADEIYGGEGNDTITGNNGADILCGEAGNDNISGGNDDDIICGGEGNDGLTGDNGDDKIDGGPGTDSTIGSGGTDVCSNGETVSACEDESSDVAFCEALDNPASSSASSAMSSSVASSDASSSQASSDASSSTSSEDSGTIATPTLLGWNVESESATLDEGHPGSGTDSSGLDLPCSIDGVFVNDSKNSLNQLWSSVDGTNVKYIRRVSNNDGATWNELTGMVFTTPHMNNWFSFGPSQEGVYLTGVMAFEDLNSNNLPDDGANTVSAWSNSCEITYDKTAPSITFDGVSEQNSGGFNDESPILECSATITTNYVAIHWTDASAEGTAPVHYQYNIKDDPFSTVNYSETKYTTYHYGSLPKQGSYLVTVTPVDAAGNTGSPVQCGFTYDAEGGSSSSVSSSSSSSTSSDASSSVSSSSSEESSSSSSSVAMCADDEDLLAYWKFDEETGTTALDSVASNDGSLQSSAGYSVMTAATTFANPSALSTGAEGYADFGDVLDMGLGDFSTSLWFKTTDNDGALISKSKYAAGQGRWFTIIENGTIKARFDAGVAGGLITVPAAAYLDGNYHHIATTYDRDGNITLYVDGTAVGSADISAHSAVDMQTSYPLYVGRYQNVAGDAPHPSTLAFNGSIDDVRVYGKALTEGEIEALSSGYCFAGDTEMVACTSTDEDLAAHYQFEGDILGEDSTTYNNEGTEQDNAQADSGSVPTLLYDNMKSLALDGTDDYVLVTDTTGLPTASSPRTIALWMNQDSITNQATLVSLGNGATANQRFIFQMGDVGGSTYIFTDGINSANNITVSGDQIPGSGWHHVAFSYDGAGNWAYYLDGALAKSGTFPIAILTDTNAVEIGARHDTGTGYFDGNLDDVRIYSTALTEDQIAALYAGSCNAEEEEESSSSSSSEGSSSSQASDGNSSSATSSTSSEGGGGSSEEFTGFSLQSGTSGGRRGDGTNVAFNFINFIGRHIGLGNGLPPAGFGGTDSNPLSEEEIDYICSIRRGLPDQPVPGFMRVVMRFIASEIGRPVAVVEAAMEDANLCDGETASLNSISEEKEITLRSFPVDAGGVPVSSNPVWNACIRNVYQLELLRSNEDTTHIRSGATPRTCADYHTRENWYHPDLEVFFTYESKPYRLELPSGYQEEEVSLVVKQ